MIDENDEFLARLRRARQTRAAENFGNAIADGDAMVRKPKTVAWTDPVQGDDLGLVHRGRPDGTVTCGSW